MRTELEITDRAGFTERVGFFGLEENLRGVYVVAKLPMGDLVALDRAYDPLGFLMGDKKALWNELMSHPAKFMHDAHANFQLSAGITKAEGIWFDLDPRRERQID